VPESTYQATFDTDPSGDWTTVRLPWHNFVPVKRAQSDSDGAPLDASQIAKLGLVLSRWARLGAAAAAAAAAAPGVLLLLLLLLLLLPPPPPPWLLLLPPPPPPWLLLLPGWLAPVLRVL
jgi:hypothetical protein